jgi:hypothetical protein
MQDRRRLEPLIDVFPRVSSNNGVQRGKFSIQCLERLAGPIGFGFEVGPCEDTVEIDEYLFSIPKLM